MPLVVGAWEAWSGRLGANPIAEALNRLGLLAFVFLVASLACTPLKAVLGWTWPMRLRRTLGLLSFGYAILHVVTYAVLDQGLDLAGVVADVARRRFIFVGFATFALLVPLAVTSTNASVRWLGFARWKRLHRVAYLAVALGLLHFVWRVKSDLSEPIAYGAVVSVLMAIRLGAALRDRMSAPRTIARGPSSGADLRAR